jgi:hypothetical protein
MWYTILPKKHLFASHKLDFPLSLAAIFLFFAFYGFTLIGRVGHAS